MLSVGADQAILFLFVVSRRYTCYPALPLFDRTKRLGVTVVAEESAVFGTNWTESEVVLGNLTKLGAICGTKHDSVGKEGCDLRLCS